MNTPRDDETQHGPQFLAQALLALALMCVLGIFSAAHAATITTNAIISICGDGIVEYGEVCDDGAGNNNSAYGSTTAQRHCNSTCSGFGPYCGDGVLQVRFTEQCDLGGSNGGTSLCSDTCQSLPPVPASTPSSVVGYVPQVPGGVPGSIQATQQTQVILRGLAYPNSNVTILLDGTKVATVLADSNASFSYNTTSVDPGTATFSFLATDGAGVDSLLTSIVFDVVQSAITTVNNIYIPPTISASGRQVAPGVPLTLSGYSVPGARVVTSLDSSSANTFTATTSGSGAWALQLDSNSLSGGFHSAKSYFSLSTTSTSGWGKLVNFYIGAQIPAGAATSDLNGDSKVNLVDFSIFLLSWGTADPRADFNGDGTVNLADFSILLFNWTG